MIWLINHFPELDHLEPEQRRQALAQVPWWLYPAMLGLAGVAALIVGVVVAALVFEFSGSKKFAVLGLPVAVGAVVPLYCLQLSLIRRAVRRTIYDAFRGERLPFCLGCGYDLRASETPRCPVCGSNAFARPAKS